MYTLSVTLRLNSVFTEAKWLNIVARSWFPLSDKCTLKKKQTSMQHRTQLTAHTHGFGHKRADLHVPRARRWCTWTHSHGRTHTTRHHRFTDESVHAKHSTDTATHRHGWHGYYLHQGPWWPTLSSWQLIITPQPAALSLMWRDCRINELASERSVTPPNYILSFAPPPPEDPINNIVVT